MFLLAVLLVLLTGFILSGIAGHYDARLRKHGPHALAFRWFFATANWAGKPVTNRGWTRPGTKALTPTGHAHRRWYLPGWQHALWRTRNTLAALLVVAGLLFQSRRTAEYLGVTAAAGAVTGAWRARSWTLERGHRKNYVKPLHARLADTAGIPLANRPESWLEIPRDLSYAVLTWPKGAQLPKSQERDTIAATAAATLGMGNAKRTWQFTGPHLRLRLVPPVPPPRLVTLEDIKRAILDADDDCLILGIGEDGKVVSVSLRNDAPHIGLSMDSGAGKSVSVRCIVPQVLFRGGISLILDNKLVSHPRDRGLPNVAYADDIGKIHDALEWLDGELTTRAQFVREHTDIYGNLAGSPGARLLVVLEEMNLTMNRLRGYWSERIAEDRALPKEDRDFLPAVSPAVRGLENAFYAGRELKVHLLFVSQRMSAKATAGSADVRMNIGIRLLAGYDADTWKMVAGASVPMPPPSRHRGRMQACVKGGDVTEVQGAFLTHAEAREFSEGGPVRVPAKLRHLTVAPAAATTAPVTLLTWPEESGNATPAGVTPVPQLGPAVRNWMTIAQAKEQGMLPRTWTKPGGAFRTAKHRAAREGIPVPPVRGKKGSEAMYDAVELADFLERITSKERQAA